MEKKYRTVPERGMLRIFALKDFPDVKKGDRGGLIEGEHNLSQTGDCWVYKNARVFGNAYVGGNAKIYGKAEVFEKAIVYEDACVYEDAFVSEEFIKIGHIDNFNDIESGTITVSFVR